MPTNFFSRYASVTGHLTFLVLASLAVIFFKERTVILDAAFQSFMIIAHDSLAIQVGRFGAAMTQVFPLLALKMKLSLQAVLIAYSLAFVVVHWVMFALCDAWLKVKTLAFGIVLFNLFLVNHTFYWVQNEIIQGTSLCLLFWAMLVRVKNWQKVTWWHWPLGLFLLATLAFFHPLMVFLFSFLAAYFLLDSFQQEAGIKRSLLLTVTGFFFSFIALKYWVFANNYDSQATARFSLGMLGPFLSNLGAVKSYRDFVAHLPLDFFLLPVTLAVLTVFYLINKCPQKLILVWLGTLGYALMVMASYQDSNDWFHVESQYLPASIFVIVPLVRDVLPSVSNSKKGLHITVAVVGLVIVARLATIVHTGNFYQKRVAFIGDTLQKTWTLDRKKFLMQQDAIDKTYLMQTWAFAYETLYFSALQSPDSTRNIMLVRAPEGNEWVLGSSDIFCGFGYFMKYGDAPRHLFNFTDSTQQYMWISAETWESLNSSAAPAPSVPGGK